MTLVEEPAVEDPSTRPVRVLRPAVARQQSRRPLRLPGAEIVRWVRIVLIFALVVVSVVGIFLWLVGPLMYQQRQHHLSAELARPKPVIEPGDASLVLQAPTVGLDVIVIESASASNLRGAPARVHGSAMPGDPGVLAIVGHRRAYGAPFGELASLRADDRIVAKARSGGPAIEYVVSDVHRHASPTDLDLRDTGTLSYLVLVTSEGAWRDHGDLIVVARALPVGDARSRTPDLDAGVDWRRVQTSDLLGLLGSVVASAFTWWFLRRRVGIATSLIAMSPAVALGLLQLLSVLEVLRPDLA